MGFFDYAKLIFIEVETNIHKMQQAIQYGEPTNSIPVQLQEDRNIIRWFQQFLKVRKKETKLDNQSVLPEKGIEETKNALKSSVLAQLIRDEDTIVRLIKQDILISAILKNAGIYDSEKPLIKDLELHLIIFDLLLLDRSSNKDETIDRYNRLIEDSTKMIQDFPTVSIEEIATNCYLEIKNIRQW